MGLSQKNANINNNILNSSNNLNTIDNANIYQNESQSDISNNINKYKYMLELWSGQICNKNSQNTLENLEEKRIKQRNEQDLVEKKRLEKIRLQKEKDEK